MARASCLLSFVTASPTAETGQTKGDAPAETTNSHVLKTAFALTLICSATVLWTALTNRTRTDAQQHPQEFVNTQLTFYVRTPQGFASMVNDVAMVLLTAGEEVMRKIARVWGFNAWTVHVLVTGLCVTGLRIVARVRTRLVVLEAAHQQSLRYVSFNCSPFLTISCLIELQKKTNENIYERIPKVMYFQHRFLLKTSRV